MNCNGCGCRDNVITIFQGDAYLEIDSRRVCFDSAGCNWPDGIVAASLVVNPVSHGCGCPFNAALTFSGVVASDDDDGTSVARPRACFELPAGQTAKLAKGHHAYTYTVAGTTTNGNRVTLDRGRVSVR